MTSLRSTASWEREMERDVLSTSAWDPVAGCMGVAQSCMRGGLDWTLGSISSQRGWSNPETIFLVCWCVAQEGNKKISPRANIG